MIVYLINLLLKTDLKKKLGNTYFNAICNLCDTIVGYLIDTFEWIGSMVGQKITSGNHICRSNENIATVKNSFTAVNINL